MFYLKSVCSNYLYTMLYTVSMQLMMQTEDAGMGIKIVIKWG